ncbi:hypothetical protein WA1_19915 [Scytonema hofmannii PCC 7110]|uniref:Contractile injection system tube protein N-terminal domain-containing protein n=1 Tax=Scytonema hofmannii PCC 7110 TaxID=128403 RepID=A0A139XC31_9CYAN|nr:hypothetical protein [Scytonema hofmannii]KYC42249.1 hypothetical protein WA1_19915 [Scytonema hofmannii PCC 7110]
MVVNVSGNLVKAQLISKDGVPPIKFMFNPNELIFTRTAEISENSGARTEDKGLPKVSFSHVTAYEVTINQIMFDTYEEGKNVVTKYIEPFKKALEFVSTKERTPIYTFSWGNQVYLRSCFIESLTYKLTMFLPNGTPVRAVIDNLTLKEAEQPKPSGSVGTQNPTNQQRQEPSLTLSHTTK